MNDADVWDYDRCWLLLLFSFPCTSKHLYIFYRQVIPCDALLYIVHCTARNEQSRFTDFHTVRAKVFTTPLLEAELYALNRMAIIRLVGKNIEYLLTFKCQVDFCSVVVSRVTVNQQQNVEKSLYQNANRKSATVCAKWKHHIWNSVRLSIDRIHDENCGKRWMCEKISEYCGERVDYTYSYRALAFQLIEFRCCSHNNLSSSLSLSLFQILEQIFSIFTMFWHIC